MYQLVELYRPCSGFVDNLIITIVVELIKIGFLSRLGFRVSLPKARV